MNDVHGTTGPVNLEGGDAGDDTAVPPVQVDMEDAPRRIDVIPGGAKADMGADEYDPQGRGGGEP